MWRNDPEDPLLGLKPKRNENICPHQNLYMNVYGNIFIVQSGNNPKVH